MLPYQTNKTLILRSLEIHTRRIHLLKSKNFGRPFTSVISFVFLLIHISQKNCVISLMSFPFVYISAPLSTVNSVLAISAIILFSVSTAFEIHSFVSSFSENHTLLIKFIRILTALCFDLSMVPKIGKSKHTVFDSGYISVHRQKRWGGTYTYVFRPDRLSLFQTGKIKCLFCYIWSL